MVAAGAGRSHSASSTILTSIVRYPWAASSVCSGLTCCGPLFLIQIHKGSVLSLFSPFTALPPYLGPFEVAPRPVWLNFAPTSPARTLSILGSREGYQFAIILGRPLVAAGPARPAGQTAWRGGGRARLIQTLRIAGGPVVFVSPRSAEKTENVDFFGQAITPFIPHV